MKLKIKTKVKVKETAPQPVEVYSEFIKLDSFLKFSALAETGGEAKLAITDGEVIVNGEVCTQRGKKLYPGDIVRWRGQTMVVTAAENET